MVRCIDCAHCAKMLHWENDYICTFADELTWMNGLDAITDDGNCDAFITADDYLEQMVCDNTEE